MREFSHDLRDESLKEFVNALASRKIEYMKQEDQLWILSEDKMNEVFELYKEYKAGTLKRVEKKTEILKKPAAKFDEKLVQINTRRKASGPLKTPWTRLFLVVCIGLFIVSFIESLSSSKGKNKLSPPIHFSQTQKMLLYDYPEKLALLEKFFYDYPNLTIREDRIVSLNEEPIPPGAIQLLSTVELTPEWIGLYDLYFTQGKKRELGSGPLFGDIKKGELWRAVSPIFLHGGILHILFNMLWLLFLGKAVEGILGGGRYVAFVFILAIFTNTLQYMMTGPLFMGFSGVISGLAGYVWMRKRKAPWEYYNVDKGSLLFLWIFIFGLLVIQIGAFITEIYTHKTFSLRIANTAHVSGILLGTFIGLFSFKTSSLDGRLGKK